MKCAMLVTLLLTTVTTFAEDKPAKEPADLVKIRKAYEAKVKAAVEPITEAYLKKLDEMKKAYGAKGDLESAQAIQKEIESMTPEKAAAKTTTKSKATAKRKAEVGIVGKWTWSDHVIDFLEDGTFKLSNGDRGKWGCLDRKTRRYENSLGNKMLLTADGTTMLVKNPNGTGFTSKRLPSDEEK